MEEYYAHNVELVGYHDLEKRPAFKIAMQVVDDRWYLYLAHFWHTGWSIVEVTDPARPELRTFVPAPGESGTYQVQVADRKMIGGLEYLPPAITGRSEDAPWDEGIFIFDVADPVNPRLLSHWKTGATGTHRNHYDGGRYVHLSAGMPGFAGNIYIILDIADPERPQEVGRFFLPEQYRAGGAQVERRYHLHGPPYVEGDRAYLGYGHAGMVIVDISDVTRPRLVSRLDFGPAFDSGLGMHTVIPLSRRKLAVVNTEAIAEEVDEAMNFAGIVDISDESKPRLLSFFPVPEAPADAPWPSFHKRGGRFGPHNQHHWQHQPHLLDRDDLVYLTYFNAGLRLYDIRDPYAPKEIGYFVQPDPKERLGNLPKRSLAAQAEDVLVDARGYAYFTEKNQGLHIVRFTG